MRGQTSRGIGGWLRLGWGLRCGQKKGLGADRGGSSGQVGPHLGHGEVHASRPLLLDDVHLRPSALDHARELREVREHELPAQLVHRGGILHHVLGVPRHGGVVVVHGGGHDPLGEHLRRLLGHPRRARDVLRHVHVDRSGSDARLAVRFRPAKLPKREGFTAHQILDSHHAMRHVGRVSSRVDNTHFAASPRHAHHTTPTRGFNPTLTVPRWLR